MVFGFILWGGVPFHKHTNLETIATWISVMFCNANTVSVLKGLDFKKRLLEMAVLNFYFIFDSMFYEQQQDVNMVFQLGPSLEIFLFVCIKIIGL